MDLKHFLREIPSRVYHAPSGDVDVFSEKNVSFTCGCGTTHQVTNAVALLSTGLTNKAVYVCPDSQDTFNLVKATGMFSITGLKTIATFKAENESQRLSLISDVESRKKLDY